MNIRSNKISAFRHTVNAFSFLMLISLFSQCQKPDQDIVLRRIKDVVVDASTDPMLKANAIFYNPNKMSGRLKKIKIDIYVNGKKTGSVDQSLRTKIPSRAEFTVPLEVKLAMKELGFFNTVLGMLGGKKYEVRYEGFLRLSYHGVPIKVPVDYKDEVRISF
jgi:LEA14-like dessication related protein